ncbi:hypothetical protein KIN20_024293 [Parelaphostrongylus tenuis]|uniref:Uncharacterized protein n=1 Tax=Parelaphostrongylus tenuis TaxID=148309 RepID=A0AAD5QTJ3_PARTN|nr:hypothetical protein KIN20_024293 [Parelaphostrongylus tenuis]
MRHCRVHLLNRYPSWPPTPSLHPYGGVRNSQFCSNTAVLPPCSTSSGPSAVHNTPPLPSGAGVPLNCFSWAAGAQYYGYHNESLAGPQQQFYPVGVPQVPFMEAPQPWTPYLAQNGPSTVSLTSLRNPKDNAAVRNTPERRNRQTLDVCKTEETATIISP